MKRLADELPVRDRVIFRDDVPHELPADYYRAADVFALSSRYEPFRMTAVEAMACGTPTVVTTLATTIDTPWAHFEAALAGYDETYTVAVAGHAETADNADAASLAGFWNQSACVQSFSPNSLA